jgi:AAA domain
MVADHLNTMLFVVFVIPGAGKTTIAKHVVQKLSSSTTTTSVGNDSEDQSTTTTIPQNYQVLDLDLDDCVPEWMRLNFEQGIYPNLQQRNEFALSCCDYVNESIQNFTQSSITNGTTRKSVDQQILVIVSFSFVNDDLRINFRNRFPNSYWILIHTSEIEAQRRIQQRSNHFYKGKQPPLGADRNEPVRQQSLNDNNEWNFAPVTFPHTIVNGHNSIEETSSEVVEWIQTTLRTPATTNGD